MSGFIICICLGFISFILIIVAFITLVSRKEGSLKKAILEFGIAVVSVFLGCYIQFGFGYIKDSIIEKTSTKNSDSNYTEGEFGNETEHTHVAYKTQKENVIEANCVDAGSYESVSYCECGKELSRDATTLEALGHNYIERVTEPTCVERGFTIHTCSRCNNTYVDCYIDALGHNYDRDICVRCGDTNPNYVKEYDSEEIMKILSKSVVSDSGTYTSYLGTKSISVFAKDRYNCFSINTAVSYNLWGHEVQSVIFNISDLGEVNTLDFNVGGETGSSGSMEIEIYVDKTLNDDADYVYQLDASSEPILLSINISDATSLGIRVTNHSNNENKLVFFDFSNGNR